MSEEEDSKCRVCQKDDQEEFLMLCDGCDAPYHSFCAKGCTCCGEKPKGNFGKKPVVPEGDWFCKECSGNIPDLPKSDKPASSVFAWGSNECFQLGLNNRKDEKISTPESITALNHIPVVDIAAGHQHMLALTEEGHVYSVGNGMNGRLGHPDIVHEYLSKFRRIEALDDENTSAGEGPVTRIFAGKAFNVAITSAGQVYTFGAGELGQLGHQENKDKKIPKKISALRQQEIGVSLVAAGDEFMMMTSGMPNEEDQFNTDKPGVFMSMGSNVHLQLGENSGRNQWVPQFLNKDGNDNTNIPDAHDDATPERFNLGRDIAQMAGGQAHSVAITEGGKLWTWGYGQLGQLGHQMPPVPTGKSVYFKPKFRVAFPRFVQALRNEIMTQVSCGAHHTLAMTWSGKVYAWGSNKSGQMGVGKLEAELAFQEFPVEIPTLSTLDVKTLLCGDEHCLALTSLGDVYSWGRGIEGQLGLGESNMTFVCTPTEIDTLPKIEKIVAAGNCSFAIEFGGKRKNVLKRAAPSVTTKPKKKKK